MCDYFYNKKLEGQYFFYRFVFIQFSKLLGFFDKNDKKTYSVMKYRNERDYN